MQAALIVEDIPETGVWLRALLQEAFSGVQVTICRNCAETTRYLLMGQVQLVLVDINLPDGSGLTLIPQILTHSPQAVVVVTTILDDQLHILQALQLGASGYLLKDLSEEQFVYKLRGILHGDPPLSPKVARKVLDYFNHLPLIPETHVSSQSEAGDDALSARETEVLVLIGKGFSRREVGELLHLSESTIATHVRNVYRKLNISSRAEAALEAHRLGLIRN